MDFRTRLLLLGIVAALVVPLVLAMLGVRNWFRAMDAVAKGRDSYVTVRATEVWRHDGNRISLAQGSKVQLYQGGRSRKTSRRAKTSGRDFEGKGDFVYVQYRSPDGSPGRGYVSRADLEKKK